MLRRLLLLTLLLLPALRATAAEPQQIAMGGRFGTVTVYRPAGPAKSVVLFVSGDGGWHLGVTGMAQHLTEQGAIVIGIDVRHYLAALGEAQQSCVSLAADFELLSHDVQKKLALPRYLAPVLAGYSSGATVVYAVLAQAPAGTFTGAISFGFCPDQDFRSRPLCPGNGLHYNGEPSRRFRARTAGEARGPVGGHAGPGGPGLRRRCGGCICRAHTHRRSAAPAEGGPWLRRGRNWLPQLRDSFARLQVSTAPAPAEATAGSASLAAALPLIEVPATGNAPASDSFAIMISGDGGWAGLDRSIAKAFAARGIPVVGIDSLRYFWSEKTPDATARDLAAIIQQYQQRWHRSGVHLLGYSFGADVLPFLANRLPPPLAASVRSVTLVAPSESATFEIHISNWIPGVNHARAAAAAGDRAHGHAAAVHPRRRRDGYTLQRPAARTVRGDRQWPPPRRRRRWHRCPRAAAKGHHRLCRKGALWIDCAPCECC